MSNSNNPIQSWGATVTNIVDGDTFDVVWDNGYQPPAGINDRIRVAGIDTNEITTNQSFSAEATARLAELIPVGTHVVLEARDENSSSQGRALRHAIVDGVNVATVLIQEGLGLPINYGIETDYGIQNFAAGESAQLAGVGMWAEGASGGDPTTWSEIEMFVNFDAGGDDSMNLNDEFVHIQNNGPYVMDLSGWQLRKSGNAIDTTIPSGTSLAVGESYRVYAGSGTNTANEMYLGLTEALFSNTDGVVYLRDGFLNIHAYQHWQETIFTGELASIVIDYAQFDAPGDDTPNPNGEWIQIRNAGHETVDLTDWRIKDDGQDYIFNSGETLDAGETLKIFIGAGVDNGNDRYWGNNESILTNQGGILEIWTPRSQAVDAYAWGDTQNTDEDLRGAIKMFANFNAEGNDSNNPNGEWVSIVNTSNSAIDLSGYGLESGSYEYTFAVGTVLAADGHLRVLVGSGTDTATELYWGNAGGIFANGGDLVDFITTDDEVLLRHEWPAPSSEIVDYGIVVDKVNFDAIGTDAANPNGEWLTIRNSSSSEQNLLNWKIVIGPEHHVFLEDLVVASGDFITVYMGEGTNTADSVYWGSTTDILYNTGSRAVEILSPSRDVVETHSWGSATSSAQSIAAAIDLSVNYDAAGTDSSNPNGEWVNLRNLSSSDVSLDGYHLYTDGTSYMFNSDDVVDAGARMRVYLGAGTDSGLDRYADGSLNVLSNTEDEVSLRSNDTAVAVDFFAYPYTDQPLVTGDFQISAVTYDAPGTDTANGEWIEITNTGTASADLMDWRVQYKTGTFFDFDESAVVAAGDTVRIYMGVGTNTATEFYWGLTSAILSNTSGDLHLQTPYRTETHTFTWNNSPSGNIFGTYGADTIQASDLDDVVYALDGDDIIELGDGDDQVFGGAGADIIYGGAGDDLVSFLGSSASVTINLRTGVGTGGDAEGDTYSSIESVGGTDDYDDRLYGTTGDNLLLGYGGDDYFRGNDGADVIKGGGGTDFASFYYSGEGVSVNLATGTGTGGEAEGDTYSSVESVGGSRDHNDTLVGDAGANALYGYGGNDYFRGGDGADYISGGSGTDRISYYYSDEGVSVNLASGALSGGHAEGDTISSIEYAYGSRDHNDTLVGNSGVNSLYGYGGNDYFRGGDGADYISGGSGTDRISYYYSDEGVSVNLASGAVSGGHAEGDTISSIEYAYGSRDHNDTLVGNSGVNSLYGYGGNDYFRGGDGADYISGGSGTDRISYYYSDEGVSVNLASGAVSGGHAEGDTISSIEYAYGSRDHNDTLVGNSGVNSLYGYGGNDYFRGGDGADYISGGSGTDRISYYYSDEGVSVNLASGAVSGGHAEGDTISSIEYAYGSRDHNDTLVGNSGVNSLYGYGGNDYFRGGDGADYISGGSGTDRISYYYSDEGVSVNLASGAVSGGHAEGDTISSIEYAYGSRDHNDTLVGDAGVNSLYGYNGSDTLNGGAGNDTIHGGGGDDTFVFGLNWGDDTVRGFSASDGDLLDFSAHNIGMGDLNINYGASDTTITYDGNEILLVGSTETLTIDDFIF